MALFEQRQSTDRERRVPGATRRTRALSVTAVENDFVEGSTRSSRRSTTSPSVRRSIPAASRRSSGWTSSRASACSRSASAPASTCRCIRATARSPASTCRASMLEKARERVARKGVAQRPAAADGRRRPQVRRQLLRHRLRAVLISVVPDPVAVAREMRRVCRPGGRIIFLNHFLSPNPLLVAHRAADLAVHHSHRLQVRPRPAGVPRPGRPEAGVDREGEHPADLVARDLRQVVNPGSARLPAASCLAFSFQFCQLELPLEAGIAVSERLLQRLRLRREQLRAVAR